MNRWFLCVGLLAAFTIAASAEPLKQGERDRALSELHASRKQVADILSSVTPAQWSYKPSPESWSIAEIAEHLIVTEQSITARVADALKQPVDAAKKEQTAGKDEMILTKVPEREKKVKTSPALEPKGAYKNAAAELKAFNALRQKDILYVRDTQDELRDHVIDHPALGPLDGYQWYLLVAAHTERHAAQMKEVMGSPGYPKK